MLYSFSIPAFGCNYCYYLLHCSDFQVVHLDGVIHLEIWKRHNHSYGFAGFVYRSSKLIYPRDFRTKKDLFDAIQLLLQEELYDIVQ